MNLPQRLCILALSAMTMACDESGNSAAMSTGMVSEQWGNDSFEIEINDSTSSFYLGMAETGNSCKEDPQRCWTGEDCYNGYGDLYYCHELGPTGGVLLYGGDANELSSGEETVFNSLFDGSITFMLEEEGSGHCWTWGDNPSYYQDLFCDEL
jgi:hypothetical protein